VLSYDGSPITARFITESIAERMRQRPRGPLSAAAQ